MKKNFIACRIDDELIGYIDSIKNEHEDRSSCLRRLIIESKKKTENVEKVVESIVHKTLDKNGFKEIINKEIKENFVSLNENILSTLKLFSESSLKVSNSVNNLTSKVNDIQSKIGDISEKNIHFEKSIEAIKKDINSIKESINNLEVTE